MENELKIRKVKSVWYWVFWILAAVILDKLFGIGLIVIFLMILFHSGKVIAKIKTKKGDEYEVYE